jgi:nicotinate phosphoribosyltransferase
MRFDPRITDGILFTDQYQLAMAQLYFKLGVHETPVQFDHFFRRYPDYGAHKAGYCVNAGLEWMLDWTLGAFFGDEEIKLLSDQKTTAGNPLFEKKFLKWLKKHGNFHALSIMAIPEGRVVHPDVPLTVVRGQLAMAQILETALLNKLNFHTLIATKTSRIRQQIGRGQLMLEFGARRGHDRGSNAGARAALIGGADFSSNVGISHVLGYSPKGTHAHSMVQFLLATGKSELEAFRAFADVYPDDCILLVDTVNTLESGLPNAIKVFEELRRKGHVPVGIRLDSGDLACLSIQAAKMLNNAGFEKVKIVLSNELDELIIGQILTRISEDAPKEGVDPDKLVKRLTYGVGTRLITSAGDSALGGVYKLVAVYQGGNWIPAVKISETVEKIPNPGQKGVWRIYDKKDKAVADLIGLLDEQPEKMKRMILHHPNDQSKIRTLSQKDISHIEPLLVDVLREGKLVYTFPSIEEIRKVRRRDIERLDAGVKRLMNPHLYHVSLTQKLWDLKQEMIRSFRK